MSSLLYSDEVARLRQRQHLPVWRVAPGRYLQGGVAPAALTPPLSMQCRGCCSPFALSAVVTQEPSCPNHWLCFKVKYVLKASQSFETISVTFQQSLPCSDSSWASFSALPMWTQTISPQLIFRFFVVNIFFYLLSYSVIYLLSCTIFSPPSTSKTQAKEAFHLCCGCELMCTFHLYSHMSPNTRIRYSITLP